MLKHYSESDNNTNLKKLSSFKDIKDLQQKRKEKAEYQKKQNTLINNIVSIIDGKCTKVNCSSIS